MRLLQQTSSKLSALVAAGVLVWCTGAAAAPIDGTKDVVCATSRVVACLDAKRCSTGEANDFGLAELIVFNAAAKAVKGTRESGEQFTSPAETVESHGNHLMLRGLENDRAWDMAIDTRSGLMRAALVGDGISFLLFGVCTAP